AADLNFGEVSGRALDQSVARRRALHLWWFVNEEPPREVLDVPLSTSTDKPHRHHRMLRSFGVIADVEVAAAVALERDRANQRPALAILADEPRRELQHGHARTLVGVLLVAC